jgi:hypothetical protein
MELTELLMAASMLRLRCQVRGTVQRVQLDDQMLLAAHPVVLSPAGVGAREASAEAGSALPMPLEGAAGSGAAAGPQPLIRWAAPWLPSGCTPLLIQLH